MTPRLRLVRRSVSQSLSVSIHLVAAGSQTPTACLARHVTMYVARTMFGMTYQEIGLEMKRHNSSVVHGISVAASLIRRGDHRALVALQAGEVAAIKWRRLSPRDELRERRDRLEKLAREMLDESARIGVALGERHVAAE